MAIKDFISDLLGAKESIKQADVLSEFRSIYPSYANIPDEELAPKIASKYPKHYSFLKDYDPKAEVPRETIRSQAVAEVESFQKRYPRYKEMDPGELAGRMEEAFPDKYSGLSKRLSLPKASMPTGEKDPPEIERQGPKPKAEKLANAVNRLFSVTNPTASLFMSLPGIKEEAARNVGTVAATSLTSVGDTLASIPAASQFVFGKMGPTEKLLKVSNYLDEQANDYYPDDPAFFDKLVGGATSMAYFGATSLIGGGVVGAAAKGLPLISKIPAAAKALTGLSRAMGIAAPAVFEASIEAGGGFKDSLDKGKSPEEASTAWARSFATNVAILAATQPPWARVFGMAGKAGKPLWQDLIAGSSKEAAQEWAQSFIQYAKDNELEKWPKTFLSFLKDKEALGDANTSALIGAILGGGVTSVARLSEQNTPPGTLKKMAEIPGLPEAVLNKEYPVDQVRLVDAVDTAIEEAEVLKAEGADPQTVAASAINTFTSEIEEATETKPAESAQMPEAPTATFDDLSEQVDTEIENKARSISRSQLAATMGIEPYQVSAEEYTNTFGEGRPETDVKAEHEAIVTEAVLKGKEVPPSIRESYPKIETRIRQEKAKTAANEIVTANKLDDAVFYEFVENVDPDPEAFKKEYGREFNPEKEAIAGETRFEKRGDALGAVVTFTKDAKGERTGHWEGFQVVSQTLASEREQKIYLRKYGNQGAAAKAFADFMGGKSTGSRLIDRVFTKIEQFVERFNNWMSSNGFESAEDVFKKIKDGKLEQGIREAKEEALYSREKLAEIKQPMATTLAEAQDQILQSFREAEESGATRVTWATDPRNPVIGRNIIPSLLIPEASKKGYKVTKTDEGGYVDIPPAPLFSVEESAKPIGDRLVTIHNLSPENLRHAEKMGGLAAPSTAIAKVAHPPAGFGSITLIGSKDLVDPQMDRSSKVFNADIYSPRYPTINYAENTSAMKDLAPRLEKAKEHFRASTDIVPSYASWHWSSIGDGEIESRGREALVRDRKLKAVFAMEQGVEPADALESDPKYQEFIDDIAAKVIKGEKIFKGYTDQGNRRYSPHTLENVLRELNKELQGGEGFNYGLPSLRSSVAKQFKTMKQVQESRGDVISDEAFEIEKKKAQEEFDVILEEANQKYEHSERMGALDAFVNVLIDAIKVRANIGTDLEKYGFPGMNTDRIGKFLQRIRNMPTEYFEAKIRRIVKLREFRGAVIPETAPDYVKDILAFNGLPYMTYAKEVGRQPAIERLAVELDKADGNVLYSVEDKGDDVDFVDQPSRKALDGSLEEEDIAKGETESQSEEIYTPSMMEQKPMSRGAEGIQAPKSAARKLASFLKKNADDLIRQGYNPVWVWVESVRIKSSPDIKEEYKYTHRRFKPDATHPGLPPDYVVDELVEAGLMPPGSNTSDLLEVLKKWETPQFKPVSSFIEEAGKIWQSERSDYLRVQKDLKQKIEAQTKKQEPKRFTESQALRRALQRESIAASKAYFQGKKDLQGIKKTIVGVLDQFLTKEQQGKYIKALASAKTGNDVGKIAIRISNDVEDAQRRFLTSRIKRNYQKAIASKAVAVDYRQRIQAVMGSVLENKPRAETLMRALNFYRYIGQQRSLGANVEVPMYVYEQMRRLTNKPIADMSVAELEDIHSQVETLANLGRVKWNTRKELEQLRIERDVADIKKSSNPMILKDTVRAFPGERLTTSQRVTNLIAEAFNFQLEKRMALTPTDVFFDLLDGLQDFAGANFRIFKERVDADFSNYLNANSEYTEKVLEMSKGMSAESFEKIGFYATARQEGGPEKLANLGYTSADIERVELTDKEMAIYLEMRRVMDTTRPLVAEVMKNVYNADMGEVRDYFPYVTDWTLLEDNEMKDRMLEQMMGLRSNVNQSFTKERIGAGKQKIKLNAMDVFIKHMDDVSYLINVQPTIKHLAAIAHREDYQNAVGDYGHKFVREWIDTLARKGSVEGAKKIRALDILRRNTGAGVLAYKASTALVQILAVNQGAAQIGGYAYRGLWHMTEAKWRAFVLDNMPEVRFRVGDDPAYRETYAFVPLEKLRRGGFWAIQKLDQIAAGAVAAGAYQKYMDDHDLKVDLSNPNKEAIAYAQRMTRRTQSSPFFKDQPGVVTKGSLTGNLSVDRAIFQFQNFMLNEWSLIRHEGFRYLGKGDWEKGIGTLIGIMFAAFAEQIGRELMKDAGNALIGYKPRTEISLSKKMLTEMLSKVPFISQAYSLFLYGNPIGIPSLQAINQFASGSVTAITGKAPETKLRGATRAAGAIGTVAGIPGAMPFSRMVSKMIPSGREERPGDRRQREYNKRQRERQMR